MRKSRQSYHWFLKQYVQMLSDINVHRLLPLNFFAFRGLRSHCPKRDDRLRSCRLRAIIGLNLWILERRVPDTAFLLFALVVIQGLILEWRNALRLGKAH